MNHASYLRPVGVSSRSIRGARSRNRCSMRWVYRSGGSRMWESAEISLSVAIATPPSNVGARSGAATVRPRAGVVKGARSLGRSRTIPPSRTHLMPTLRRPPGKYIVLLASLILLVVTQPLVVGQYLKGALIESLAGLLILIFAASLRARVFVVAAVLFGVAVGLNMLLLGAWEETAATRHLVLTVCTLTAAIVFLGFICGVILYDVLVRMPVTWNTVCGSLCVYLLAGAICAYLYMLIYLTDPGAFAGTDPVAA